AHLDFDTFSTTAHGVLYRALHGTTEHHTTLELTGNTLCNQLGIQIRFTDFFDIDVYRDTHQIADIFTQNFYVFAFFTNHDTRTGSVNSDFGVLCRALDNDLADRGFFQALFDQRTNSDVSQQVVGVFILTGIPDRIMVFGNT